MIWPDRDYLAVIRRAVTPTGGWVYDTPDQEDHPGDCPQCIADGAENDDDGDDAEGYDGGFGYGSYFHDAMRKD